MTAAEDILTLARKARTNRRAGLAPPEPHSHYETCLLAIIEGLAEQVVDLDERLADLQQANNLWSGR